jgi:hypothetical protein
MTNCPACGSPDAYVGTLFVECPEDECEFFTKVQAEMVHDARIRERNKKMDEARKNDATDGTSSVPPPGTGFQWGGLAMDPQGFGTGKIRYKQMTFDDISDNKRSDADVTPLATPVNSPAAPGKTQADQSTQGQTPPPFHTPDEDMDFFAIYYTEGENTD